MRLTLSNLILLIVCVVLAFGSGFAVGIREAVECRLEKQRVQDDLRRAVARGIIVETHLKLCRDEQQGEKK